MKKEYKNPNFNEDTINIIDVILSSTGESDQADYNDFFGLTE